MHKPSPMCVGQLIYRESKSQHLFHSSEQLKQYASRSFSVKLIQKR